MNATRRRPVDQDDHFGGEAPVLRPEEFANILRLRPQLSEGRAYALTAHDITAALDLVHDAAASIRDADERIRDGESRTAAILQRAADELKNAEARAAAAEARAKAAENRVREAETRAEEAENWLRQIFAAISEELPAKR